VCFLTAFSPSFPEGKQNLLGRVVKKKGEKKKKKKLFNLRNLTFQNFPFGIDTWS
jgi:hypothetical protein